jgi:hypothetical protein
MALLGPRSPHRRPKNHTHAQAHAKLYREGVKKRFLREYTRIHEKTTDYFGVACACACVWLFGRLHGAQGSPQERPKAPQERPRAAKSGPRAPRSSRGRCKRQESLRHFSRQQGVVKKRWTGRRCPPLGDSIRRPTEGRSLGVLDAT